MALVWHIEDSEMHQRLYGHAYEVRGDTVRYFETVMAFARAIDEGGQFPDLVVADGTTPDARSEGRRLEAAHQAVQILDHYGIGVPVLVLSDQISRMNAPWCEGEIPTTHDGRVIRGQGKLDGGFAGFGDALDQALPAPTDDAQ